MCAVMVISDWLVAKVNLKDVWKCVMTMLGALSVMICGARLTLVLPVCNWDTNAQVKTWHHDVVLDNILMLSSYRSNCI